MDFIVDELMEFGIISITDERYLPFGAFKIQHGLDFHHNQPLAHLQERPKQKE
ncbi:MAG: hypothetical protein Q7J80_17535 [Anaerolineales bacterium]|nr:hypothetical protein [Anaerolineales bacterium]